jgi:glycine hydroxymethyltransferase
VTTTTHKTLRGPRGGLVLCRKEFAEAVDKGCPLVLGGPLPHVLAAKAVCFTEALQPEFRTYSRRIVENSRALAQAFVDNGQTVISGGTDNHLVLLDVRPFGLTGRQAESAVRECSVTLNRNTIPFDPNGPWYTSGLRLGTPAVTTLGMGAEEMKEIASVMTAVLSSTRAESTDKGPSKAKYSVAEKVRAEARERVHALLGRFPVYPELDAAMLQEFVGQLAGATAQA